MGESGLKDGRAVLRSAGPITFGPDGILFLADNAAAKVFAVDVADPGAEGGTEPFDLENVDALRRLVPGLRARRHHDQGHGGPSAVTQCVPVGPARSR